MNGVMQNNSIMDFTVQVQENAAAAIADDGDGFGLQGRASSKASKRQMAEMAVGLSETRNDQYQSSMLVHGRLIP